MNGLMEPSSSPVYFQASMTRRWGRGVRTEFQEFDLDAVGCHQVRNLRTRSRRNDWIRDARAFRT